MGPWDVSQGSESTLKPSGKRKRMLIVNQWMYTSTQILLLLYDQGRAALLAFMVSRKPEEALQFDNF